MPPELTKPIRLTVAALAGVGVLSALLGAYLALATIKPVAWMWFGFEVVNIVAGMLGLLVAAGRFRVGPALALGCVALTFFVGTVFGRIGVMASPSMSGLFQDLWIVGRTALAGGLCGCATVAVLSRSDKGWGLLLKGLVLGGVTFTAIGLFVVTKGGWLTSSGTGLLEIVRVVCLFLVAALVAVGISVSVHLVIRSFESGQIPDAGDR